MAAKTEGKTTFHHHINIYRQNFSQRHKIEVTQKKASYLQLTRVCFVPGEVAIDSLLNLAKEVGREDILQGGIREVGDE